MPPEPQHPGGYPTEQCRLFIQLELERSNRTIAEKISEIASNVNHLTDVVDEERRVVRGQNLDNGILSDVQACQRELRDLREQYKGLPNELRDLVRKWGFALIGVQLTINAGFLTLMFTLIKHAVVGAR